MHYFSSMLKIIVLIELISLLFVNDLSIKIQAVIAIGLYIILYTKIEIWGIEI